MSILDMRELAGYTDVFVICSARNRRQVQAIAAEARRVAKEQHGILAKVEGMEAARWVLADFGSVVLHVFDEQLRGFYDLDGLWRDAPRLPVPELPERESGEFLSM
jgi:ribosome silencing factor RsfS/YbeB/iojap